LKQVVQEVGSGRTGVREVPDPSVGPGQILVAAHTSLLSAGTERHVVELAKKSLLGKARQRPDQVRRVLQKLKHEGVLTTVQQVRAKLDEPMALGYSTAGVVLACGRGVSEFKPGDRVAAAAPHGELVVVGRNLCAKVPDGVSLDKAAYAGVASIGLQGVRLGELTLGSRVLVIGLGLIGQIVVCLLKAQGCRVFGTDVDPKKLELAQSFGADAVGTGSPREAVRAFSDGQGVDAVIITAATASNEPIEFAADACRTKGRIVLVGVVGLQLPRPPFFQKELEFTVSASLGAGRWDAQYEEKGIDYPIGHARWTVQRNMRTVLELMDAGRLPVERLTTHRFPIEKAPEAYALITSPEPYSGVLLEYPGVQDRTAGRKRVDFQTRSSGSKQRLGLSVVGAGNFARLMLLPTLGRMRGHTLRGLVSAKGLNASDSGERLGFAFAASSMDEVLADKETDVVFIATRHDLHAQQIIAALKAGKHVFVEKPLCLREEELQEIRAQLESLGSAAPVLMVGFNRRFSPSIQTLKGHFWDAGPLSVTHRFAPGALPKSAWPQDEDWGGGRIVGEACHAIDTCTSIHDSPPVRVFAESVGASPGLETTDDRVFITLRHANGGISNISYQAGGDRAGPSERLEVFGGGRTGTVEGWDEIALWKQGTLHRASGKKDKGHVAELREFLKACQNGGPWPIAWEQLEAVSLASIRAVTSLREGEPFEL
jgi:predicted dehydrogenase